MAVDVKMPNVGESVQEGVIHKWRVKTGDFVNRDDVLVELETDKATVEVVAENSGVIEIIKKQGETVAVGDVMAKLDTDAKGAAAPAKAAPPPPPPAAASASQAKQADHSSADNLSPATRRITEELGVNPSQISGSGKDGRVTKGDVIAHVESGAKAASSIPAPKAPSAPAGDIPHVLRSARHRRRRDRRAPTSAFRPAQPRRAR